MNKVKPVFDRGVHVGETAEEALLREVKEETGEDAIPLLDDVMSELDIERQEYLIKTLKENQLFITTTDIDQKLIESFPDAKIIISLEGLILISGKTHFFSPMISSERK